MNLFEFMKRFRKRKFPKSEFNIDFHCHSTLRVLNTTPAADIRNMWSKTYNPHINNPIGRWARYQTYEIAKYSQANFYSYSESNTRIIFDNLYPVEKGWLEFRKLPNYIVGEKAREELMMVGFGVDRKRLQQLREKEDYFSELEEIYNFLTQNQGFSPNKKWHYKIAGSYEEIEKSLQHDKNLLLVIPCIEGAHALEAGSPKSLNLPEKSHQKLLGENIEKLKSWTYPPFYITFAHHFWNQLCGHARSMKMPINLMFNQNTGRDKDILQTGWYVIDQLLSKSNGNRILIDTKHMSLKARKSFYNYIEDYNRNNPLDKIPIIFSHGGFNGYETMDDSINLPDNGRKMRGHYFHNWSINISAEEAFIIYNSGGLIGIMVDKSLLGSPDQLKYISTIEDKRKKREAFIKLIWDNIFSIINAINKPDAWDTVVFGSDYDGMITHLDPYDDASSILTIKKDMLNFLKKYEYKKHLWFNYTPENIIRKFFSGNTFRFLSKHYNKVRENEKYTAKKYS